MVGFAILLLLAAPVDRLPLRISSVRIVQSGVADPPGDRPDRCKSFRPKAAQVQAWFKAARRISSQQEAHADFSQCMVRGTLLAVDGRKYRWELDQAGVGVIIMPTTDSLFFKGKALDRFLSRIYDRHEAETAK